MIGRVESLWRYPVKSMRGEELETVFVGSGGVQGDRLFAFRSSASPAHFPYFTAREQHEMLRYRPRFRSAANDAADLPVEVETPTGETLGINDPALIDQLRRGADPKHGVTLMRSERALADCFPVSIMSLQTVKKLGEEMDTVWDKRRFRANIYLDLPGCDGFAEDQFVGRRLRIGATMIVSIVARDARCMMITLDPETAARTPRLFNNVAHGHEGRAGVYATVLTEGGIRQNDSVELLD